MVATKIHWIGSWPNTEWELGVTILVSNLGTLYQLIAVGQYVIKQLGRPPIAPWFRLHYQSCGHSLKPKHTIYAFFNLQYWNFNENMTKINKKMPGSAHLKNNKTAYKLRQQHIDLKETQKTFDMSN